MRSNTGSPGFVGKTDGLCQSPSFLDQEERGLWVRDCTKTCQLVGNAEFSLRKQLFISHVILKWDLEFYVRVGTCEKRVTGKQPYKTLRRTLIDSFHTSTGEAR